jgi:transcriptional regulator with XRE-family HTH domain
MPNSLGQRIRERRIELGLTQEALAERIGDGVRQAEVSRLEHDRVVLPRRQRLEHIARALEMPLGTLLVESGWAGAEVIDDHAGAVSAPAADDQARQGAVTVLKLEDLTPSIGEERLGLREAMARSSELLHETRSTVNRAHDIMSFAETTVKGRQMRRPVSDPARSIETG